jgi:hypothetical protein
MEIVMMLQRDVRGLEIILEHVQNAKMDSR